MRMKELLESPVHLMRAYDLQDLRHLEGPYYINNEEHDPGQYSSSLLVKVVDTNDKMTPAFKDLGFIPVSSYAKWPEVVAAAKQMIAKLGH